MMNFFSGPMGWYTSILLVIPAMLLAMYAQIKVSSTFNRYLQTPLRNPMTGEAAARRILDANGLYHGLSVNIHSRKAHNANCCQNQKKFFHSFN